MTTTVLLNALGLGLAMSTVLALIVLVSLRVNPLVGLKDYPPDLRGKSRKHMHPDTQKHRYWFGIPFLLVTLGSVIFALVRLPQAISAEFTFGQAFLTAATMLMVFNLVDLLLIDGLLGTVMRPDFMILPGTTKKMKAYSDFNYYLSAFLRTSLMMLLYSVAVAAFAMAAQSLL
jgi:hypothetical protein